MYCTKCGATVPQNATSCPNCGAPRRVTPQSARSASRLEYALAVAACAIVLLAIGAMVFHNSSTNEAATNSGAGLFEAARSVRPHMLHNDATLVSAANLMLLPKADTGFVGTWGGTLKVQATPDQMQYVTMKQAPASYYFGERDGVVFIKTDVYGDPRWPVVKTGVKVLNPRSVEFRIDSECKSCQPAERQQEVTTLTLVNPNEVDAQVATYCYESGDNYVQLNYSGKMHLLTPAQLSAINREVEHDGKLLTQINSKAAAND